MEIVYREESYAILDACFEVYKEKGCSFLERVFQACLAIEFALQQIPFVAQHPLALTTKIGRSSRCTWQTSFASTR